MNKATIKWLASAPSWNELELDMFHRPEILQFNNDDFMQELLNQVAQKPAKLSKYHAKFENWRGDAKVESHPGKMRTPPKLYQPAHQRHYLVTACLVCQLPGLPDRHVETGRKESVGFVLRRLLPANAGTPAGTKVEYALVTNTPGPTWTQVLSEGRSSEDVLVPAEEVLPLFPIYYVQENGYRRRLYSGNIPVAKREIYELSPLKSGGQNVNNAITTDPKMALKLLFYNDIVAPWKNLIESAIAFSSMSNDDQFNRPNSPFAAPVEDVKKEIKKSQIKTAREQIQTGSWYILLDFANYLKKYMSTKMVDAIIRNSDSELDDPEKPLFQQLNQMTLPANLIKLIKETFNKNVKANLREALKAVLKSENEPGESRDMTRLEQEMDQLDVPYLRDNLDPRWPKFLFPLADPEFGGVLPAVSVSAKPDDPYYLNEKFNEFLNLVKEVLPAEPPVSVPAIPLSAQLSSQGRPEVTDGIYVIRCVYSRPECQPLKTDVLSEPTQEFLLASFFDPDAPGRPIRITLPEDPTPAGLRKYAKNTAFMISDVLCGQMNAMKKVTFGDLVLSVLPWPFHKDLPIGEMKPCLDGSNKQTGHVCSLSIPIITICAMFLLMMIVFILDFVFRWIPWFITCFPLPNFRSKK